MIRFAGSLLALVCTYAVLFQAIMAYEGQEHSWVTGFYWTLSTMSTLGYGDIAFVTDVGRLYSIVVLLSGIIFMLVLLPFTFIELFYAPWMEARAASSIPRKVPSHLSGHVIMTFYGPVATALITKLRQFNYPYVVVLPESEQVMSLGEQGIHSICGDLDNPETYRHANVETAALVVTTRTDIVNTTVVFTVRGITTETPIIATARDEASVEILKLAGCTRVLNLTELMANALARRAIGGRQFTHIVGRIDDLIIAEVNASRTTLVGETLGDAQANTSVSIVGAWTRGDFEANKPDHVIEDSNILVMVGSSQQIKEFDATCQDMSKAANTYASVVIIGGGRVGRATGAALARRGIDYKIVEQAPERIRDKEHYVLGSGADRQVLEAAGFTSAPTVIITTRDDETNIYLTIFCRLLRPDIQIISRSTLDRNVAALHRAGSDMVMSYASMGANSLFNLLQRSDLRMIAEGLDVFKVPVPKALAGKTLGEVDIHQKTGCRLIGIDSEEHTLTNPALSTLLPEDGEIVLIGTPEAEMRYLKEYAN